METEKIEKVFPPYFCNFIMPEAAKEQEIAVYRACPSRKIEKESFLNTYEQNGFRNTVGKEADDPQEYSLSCYTRVKDVRRFVVLDSRYQPPWLLAKGHTTKSDGKSCKTKDWKKKHRSSHVTNIHFTTGAKMPSF